MTSGANRRNPNKVNIRDLNSGEAPSKIIESDKVGHEKQVSFGDASKPGKSLGKNTGNTSTINIHSSTQPTTVSAGLTQKPSGMDSEPKHEYVTKDEFTKSAKSRIRHGYPIGINYHYNNPQNELNIFRSGMVKSKGLTAVEINSTIESKHF